MLSREPATEQETQWAYDLVDILAKLGKTRKDIAEGSNLSSSTIARLANRKVHPTKNVWKKLYEYGRQVDTEMNTHQMMTDDNKSYNSKEDAPIDQKFEFSNNQLIWLD